MFEQMVRTGFSSELEKQGARVGLKMIRRLVAEGTPEAMAKAERLAKATGVLKDLPGGHQVKLLGRPGAEGAAQLVAGARHSGAGGRGLAVKKIYDPNSPIASPEVIQRKLQLSQDFSHPRLAKTYGFGTEKNIPVSFHEFAAGASPGHAEMRALKPEIQEMLRGAKKKGWVLGDVRGPNIVGGKVIDPLPFKPGEFAGQIKNRIDITPKGGRILGMGQRMRSPDLAESRDFARMLADESVAASQAAGRRVRKVRGAREHAGEQIYRAGPGPKGRGREYANQPKNPKPPPTVASEAIEPPFRGPVGDFVAKHEWVVPAGLATAGAGVLGYKALKKRREQQQQGKKKAASMDWAWKNGLRDELQKIATLSGLVLSQLARREVMPPTLDVIARAEEGAARKLQAFKASESPTDLLFS